MSRRLQVPVYWLIVGVAVMVVSPILSIYASVQINRNTTARLIAAAEQSKVEARNEATIRYCRLIGAQVDVYAEATSPVGRDAYDTWLTEYRLQGCQPGR